MQAHQRAVGPGQAEALACSSLARYSRDLAPAPPRGSGLEALSERHGKYARCTLGGQRVYLTRSSDSPHLSASSGW